jgi:hypothetical protein
MTSLGGSPVTDLTGARFGRLLVSGRAGSNEQRFALWQCTCDCGGSVVARGNSLRDGSRKSCGCARRAPRPKPARVLKPSRLAMIRHRAVARAA